MENRLKQKQRDLKRRASGKLVKRDALKSPGRRISGVYRLIPESVGGLVKRDALTVRIDYISGDYRPRLLNFDDCKDTTQWLFMSGTDTDGA
ncbi:hypothetical protein EPICR_130040 [Candidatus Desulfarcum epimagneticum]|uniref:Uncharacterized protein n=1 Tax=uncultured Desulfobacteraceae bacterium TaxID=218296 RepID=A0A484HES6_9BACT|nr:hypothetical protein EPICR_130040 [uncultured Desulfobacteraceae bacterium]